MNWGRIFPGGHNDVIPCFDLRLSRCGVPTTHVLWKFKNLWLAPQPPPLRQGLIYFHSNLALTNYLKRLHNSGTTPLPDQQSDTQINNKGKTSFPCSPFTVSDERYLLINEASILPLPVCWPTDEPRLVSANPPSPAKTSANPSSLPKTPTMAPP